MTAQSIFESPALMKSVAQFGDCSIAALSFSFSALQLRRCGNCTQVPGSPAAGALTAVWTAQVMKAVSGKFHPIFQWFYFDSVESLPENLPLPAEEVDLQVRPGMLTLRLPLRFALVYGRYAQGFEMHDHCWRQSICTQGRRVEIFHRSSPCFSTLSQF